MNDQAYIQSLCADLMPVKSSAPRAAIFSGLLLGGMVSLTALISTIGLNADVSPATGLWPLIIKGIFALSLAAIGFAATVTLARPDGMPTQLFSKVVGIVILLASFALVQSGHTNNMEDSRLLLGATWQSCSLRIAALSLPFTAVIGWVVRRQAPVHLRKAGAAVGLTAGAAAAAIYALACAEPSAMFVLVWYTAGIAISTGLGALLGPLFLRW